MILRDLECRNPKCTDPTKITDARTEVLESGAIVIREGVDNVAAVCAACKEPLQIALSRINFGRRASKAGTPDDRHNPCNDCVGQIPVVCSANPDDFSPEIRDMMGRPSLVMDDNGSPVGTATPIGVVSMNNTDGLLASLRMFKPGDEAKSNEN